MRRLQQLQGVVIPQDHKTLSLGSYVPLGTLRTGGANLALVAGIPLVSFEPLRSPFPLGAWVSLVSLLALKPLYSLVTLKALGAHIALVSLGTLGARVTLVSLGALDPLIPFRPYLAGVAFLTLEAPGTGISLWAHFPLGADVSGVSLLSGVSLVALLSFGSGLAHGAHKGRKPFLLRPLESVVHRYLIRRLAVQGFQPFRLGPLKAVFYGHFIGGLSVEGFQPFVQSARVAPLHSETVGGNVVGRIFIHTHAA